VVRLVVLLLFAAPVLAQDPVLERRVTDLSHELRCLVCQNQTLADSNAPLAVDLRNEIREQLKSGKSERDVRAFMVERYGDFVLYRPPFKATTVVLWIGPFLLLALGIWLFYRRVAQRRIAEVQLSESDRARAAKLLE
jgi:cytochrome c-type biogenesis protein CcmH